MKSMIVCVSVSHGNTRRIADAMGEVLEARVVTPEEVDPAELYDCDLVGFGSGIYNMAFHPQLREFVQSLPDRPDESRKAFVLSSSGLPVAQLRPVVGPLVRSLAKKGFEATETFSCRGWDTFLPFKLVGGIRKGRPDTADLQAAQAFAQGLRDK